MVPIYYIVDLFSLLRSLSLSRLSALLPHLSLFFLFLIPVFILLYFSSSVFPIFPSLPSLLGNLSLFAVTLLSISVMFSLPLSSVHPFFIHSPYSAYLLHLTYIPIPFFFLFSFAFARVSSALWSFIFFLVFLAFYLHFVRSSCPSSAALSAFHPEFILLFFGPLFTLCSS